MVLPGLLLLLVVVLVVLGRGGGWRPWWRCAVGALVCWGDWEGREGREGWGGGTGRGREVDGRSTGGGAPGARGRCA